MLPPNIPKDILRQLLIICTTKTPFIFNNTTYIQVDGCSMGGPLAPTFADFYMSALEVHTLSQQNELSNPLFYVRYVDDVLTIFRNSNHIQAFINRLTNNSALEFTYEKMQGDSFNFLDVKLKIVSNKITTSVYIKPTNNGLYSHYRSSTLESYKTATIKTLIHRALKLSSTWVDFHVEARRILQVFADNGYPQKITESIINKAVTRYMEKVPSSNSSNEVVYFTKLISPTSFRDDEKSLKSIIDRFVKPMSNDTSVILKAYFQPHKLSTAFANRPSLPTEERSHVVYKFVCSEAGCNASYIGYTTCDLSSVGRDGLLANAVDNLCG